MSEPSMDRRGMDRRGFFRAAAAAAAAGAALSGCEHGHDPYAIQKPPVPGAAGWLRGEERSIATSCAQCPAGCGVRVRVVEGRAVKIEGNPASPINRGGVGPRGLAGPQVLYDPDRVLRPMKRVVPRGVSAEGDAWRAVEWDEALDAVASRLASLRAEGRPERLAIVSGRERGLLLELWRRFARVYGTPNLLEGWSSGSGPMAAASFLMQGVAEQPAYDWPRARYVLSLGSGMLESSCQAVYFARSQAEARRGRTGSRAKVVHVGPAFTRTAASADEFVRVLPQSYGALALGIAHVLVREGLHDQEFVREHATGFEDWTDEEGRERAGLRRRLEAYTPERVAAVCGLRPERVEGLAREMAATRPCFALGGSEELLSPSGLATAMAIHALNALLGALERPGGVLMQRSAPLADWPEAELDEIAEAGLARPALGAASAPLVTLGGLPQDLLPEAILAAGEDAPQVLFVHQANPLYARGRVERWRAALARVPLIVGFGPVLDETTAEQADWILPDQSFLERWEDAAAAPSVGRAVFGLRQPAVEPLGESHANGDVLIELAKRLGEPLAAAFPWSDFRDALRQRMVGLYRAKRGSIVEDKGSGFLKRLHEEGVWHDEELVFEAWDEALRTPSKRFEFVSSHLLRRLREVAAASGTSVEEWLRARGLREEADELCAPRHVELAWSGDPERFPLLLQPFRPSTYCEGSGANLPWLQELRPHVGRPIWTTEAELHPTTAKAAGLARGDRALLASAVGEIEVRVHVDEGVAPGLVRVPQGGGHSAMGRFAKGWGANVMRLVALEGQDHVAGISPLQGTRVSIRRITT